MNTKLRTPLLMSLIVMMGIFASCSDPEEIAKPEITGLEVGLSDSHVAYIGADLHLEAEIVAEGKIDVVEVHMHAEDGSGFEIEEEFDDYSGMKNATFHKHVDIPENAPAGEYHMHLIVTDMEGNSTEVDADVDIQELADEDAPVMTISSAPTSGQTFANGETITISGNITDNVALGGMLVGLVYESDAIADADVTGANSKVIVMMHTHDFDDPDETDFTASIAVGAAMDNNMTPAAIEGDNAWKSGNYYILVRAEDAVGNWTFSDHYPLVVSL